MSPVPAEVSRLSVEERFVRFQRRASLQTLFLWAVIVGLMLLVAWYDYRREIAALDRQLAIGAPPPEIDVVTMVVHLGSLAVVGMVGFVILLLRAAQRWEVRCSECARLLIARWRWFRAKRDGICPCCAKPIRNFFRASRAV